MEENSKRKYATIDKKPCIHTDKAQNIQENPSHKIRFHNLAENKIEDKENILADN
jgi:hypothetical protein